MFMLHTRVGHWNENGFDCNHHGFTLIELLVVVTIIVVLLALLVPAMDEAIYQAELAVCMANLKGVAGGSVSYAMDSKRRYFHRAGVEEDIKFQPEQLASPYGFDDRAVVFSYVTWKLFLDPLSGKVDLRHEATGVSTVFANYDLWAGFRYRGRAGMDRIGSRFVWAGLKHSILAGDIDMVGQGAGQSESSHGDHQGTMSFRVLQSEADPKVLSLPFTFSRWEKEGDHLRGPLDLNWAFDDTSVHRFEQVPWDEQDRMVPVPAFSDGTELGKWKGKIPRE